MTDENNLDLSKHRIEKAKKELDTAKENFSSGKMNASVNRAYYAIFHALRAVVALDGFDSKKHKGIISYFNRNYVKTGIFPADTSSIIDSAFDIRGSADYEDYYEVSNDEAQKQINNAEHINRLIQSYLEAFLVKIEKTEGEA